MLQAYFYFQMVADSTRVDHERNCNFGFTLDGDVFLVDRDITRRYFQMAAVIIAVMRSRQGDYEQYLLQLVDKFKLHDSRRRSKGE